MSGSESGDHSFANTVLLMPESDALSTEILPDSAREPESAGPLTLLIDGLCPLCKREAAWLDRRDKRGRLAFVDIAAADFDPSVYGRTYDELMGAIHAVSANGEIITGVEVFRRAYAEIGMGWLLAPTRWPVVRPVADLAYRLFAKVRPRLQRSGCDSGRCRI